MYHRRPGSRYRTGFAGMSAAAVISPCLLYTSIAHELKPNPLYHIRINNIRYAAAVKNLLNRQHPVRISAFLIQLFPEMDIPQRRIIAGTPIPVSYTHLDVYKRQAQRLRKDGSDN